MHDSETRWDFENGKDIKKPIRPLLVKYLREKVKAILKSAGIENVETREDELYDMLDSLSRDEFSDPVPGCMVKDTLVAKEFEIVLCKDPKDSYFQSKASKYKKNKFVIKE